MNTKKLVFNNEQYNILTSIKIGKTAFLICLDVLDNKVIYFKQEVVDGKVKLTSSANIVANANEVNKKSLSNKTRILDAFAAKVCPILVNTVFVDHAKVSKAFNDLTVEIDNCDLKYYMIDNASIEETDEQIENFMYKFNGLDFNKDLEKVNEIKNELYYFSTQEEEAPTPKVEAVSNDTRIELNNNNEEEYQGPSVASDPFASGSINDISLDNNNSVADAVNKHLEEYAPKKEDLQTPEQIKKNKRTNYIIIAVVLLGLGVFMYFHFFSKPKVYTTKEIMEKANNLVNLKEIEEGQNYNVPDKISTSYQKALANKLISVDVVALKTLNSDTIGWIRNDYLNIDYPIVKYSNNGYYSNHDYMKSESNGGWIYLDSNTDLDKIDRNNVIYGKSDINSTFFYSLKNVLTPDFVKDVNNQVVKISTADADTLWLIFSIYEIANEDYYLTNDFKDDQEYLKFLDTINERSIHDFNIDLDEYDKILTLTTNKDNENRIVVHAKLIKVNSRVKEEEEVVEEEETTDEEVEEDKKDDENKEDGEKEKTEKSDN